MPPRELVIEAPELLARTFAERFAAQADAAIAARGRFSCALPGGSVAATFFPALAHAPVAWNKVEFFWGDERAVGPDDPASNYRLAKQALLDAVGADPRRVHRMIGERADLAAAAREYAEEMVRVLGEPPQLDLIVLGVGPDGHVCSLFPGHPLLDERVHRVAAIHDSPKPPARRITLTVRAFEEAAEVCIAALGRTKAEVMRAALTDAAAHLPVAMALRLAQRAVVFLDPEAAGQLENH